MEEVKGRCCKCKKMVQIVNGKVEKTKNNRNILKGHCGICQTKVCKFVKKSE